MPIVNGIVTAPFNTFTIARHLGIGESSVGNIIAKAIEGGTLAFTRPDGSLFKTAFDTNVKGEGTGYILAGANPYWNVFSNESPGIFIINSYKIGFKILHFNKYQSVNDFSFDLSKFEGYSHDEYGPSIQGSSSYSRELDKTSYHVDCIAGSYNWGKLAELLPVLLPLKLGIRVYRNDVTFEDFYSTRDYAYDKENPEYNSFFINEFRNGNISKFTAHLLFKDSAENVIQYSEALSGVFSSKVEIYTKYAPYVIISLYVVYDQETNNPTQVSAMAVVVGDTAPANDINLTIYISGNVNGMGNAAVQILNPSMRFTIAKGTFTTEEKRSGLNVDWESININQTASVESRIETIEGASEYQRLTTETVNRPREPI